LALTLERIDVYVETGSKRTFAGALDWPGWARSGRSEAAALGALLNYGPRYARVVALAGLKFRAPTGFDQLRLAERLNGNATTDFGAPAVEPSVDSRPYDEPDLRRDQDLLRACWHAFDAAVQAAGGKELTTGPRDGGRSLDAIRAHVREAEIAYLARLGVKYQSSSNAEAAADLGRVHETILGALWDRLGAGLPAPGPHGGVRWTARYFVRRCCWHVVDHAWEIEDRTT
jgi:hypothetical protein